MKTRCDKICKDTTQRWGEANKHLFMVRVFFLHFMISPFKKFKHFHLTQITELFSLVQNHLKLWAGLSGGNYKG